MTAVGGDIAGRNVAARRDDRYPMLSPYRRLLALRRSERVLLAGHFVPRRNQGDVLLLDRRLAARRLLIALNVGQRARADEIEGYGRVLLSTDPDRGRGTACPRLQLRAAEGVVVEL